MKFDQTEFLKQAEEVLIDLYDDHDVKTFVNSNLDILTISAKNQPLCSDQDIINDSIAYKKHVNYKKDIHNCFIRLTKIAATCGLEISEISSAIGKEESTYKFKINPLKY